MERVLESLRQTADVVILDGPPLIVVDATILAKQADGVLVIARHAHTRRDELKTAVEQLQRAGVRILGGILNRIPDSADNYYSRYSQYYKFEDVPKNKVKTDKLPSAPNAKSRLKLHIEDLQTAERTPVFGSASEKSRLSKGEGLNRKQ
jgi:Mrp family chromosome partitioning ATPase